MLITVEDCEEILSILSIRELIAKIADGDIESSEIEQASAVIKCSNIDYMFGFNTKEGNKVITKLEEQIYLKQNRLAKEKRESPNPLIDFLNILGDFNKSNE